MELKEILEDFFKNDDFLKLAFLRHHNTSRIIHSTNVAICSYKLAKTLNLKVNYNSLIRGCLFHDFFLYQQHTCPKKYQHIFYHAEEAYKNTSNLLKLNNIEKNMIRCHMFPLSLEIPKYKESWIITICDKYCATMEAIFKLNCLSNLEKKYKIKTKRK